MLKIKSGPAGCRIAGVRPEVLVAVLIADEIYAKHGLDLVWSSCGEGAHKAGSLHYAFLAGDFRLPPESLRDPIRVELKEALGDDYDVVVEENHYHIEFQPKRGINA